MNRPRHHYHLLSFASALALLGLGSASGQTVPATSAAPAKTTEEVVELSPFIVNAGEDNGYQAANTLAGSRMNTSLKDTAASISIITEQLMEDVSALDLKDAIAFGNNVEFDDTQTSNDNATFEFFQTFRIRGQAATVARNYFRWKLPTNTYNVERVEEARGPNSILFGLASAGGLISTSTKQASTSRNFVKTQFLYGSFDLRRSTVDINQVLIKDKLGLRLNGLWQKNQGYQHFVSNREYRGHAALKYNLTPNTVIRVEYERGDTRGNKANNQEVGDNVTRWFNAGSPLVGKTGVATGVTRNGTAAQLSVSLVDDGQGNITTLDTRGGGITVGDSAGIITDPVLIDNVHFKANIGGPSQIQESDFQTYTATIEQKFGKNTHFQLAFNHQDSDFESWQSRENTGLKGDPNQFLRDGVTPNPNAGGLYFQTYWATFLRNESLDNLRATLSQELNLGKWLGEYRLAALGEREWSRFARRGGNEAWFDEATGRGAFNANPESSANRVFRRHYVTVGDQGTYFASSANPQVNGFISGLVDPSNPSRTLKTELAQGIGGSDDTTRQDSYLFAGQAYYWKRKLVLAGGYRDDTLRLHESVRSLRDPVTNEGVVLVDEAHPRNFRKLRATTRTYGAVFHALPWLSLRYNNSDSQELANVNVRLMPRPDANGHFIGSRVGDNPQGKGEDYGFDLDLFDGKIFIRATRFTTSRVGAQAFTFGSTVNSPTVFSNRVMDALLDAGLVTQQVRDQHQLNVGGSEFDVDSDGYEVSLTANVTKNWRLSFNYSTTDSVSSNIAPEIQVWAAAEIPFFQSFDQSILVSTGDTIAQEIARWQLANENELSVAGKSTIGNREEKLSAVSSYSFREGFFKGLNVGGTVRYQGKNVLGFSTLTNETVFGNGFTRADAFVGYNFRGSQRFRFLKDLRLQLNVQNVFDQQTPLINRFANINAEVLVANRVVPQEPRTWRLTASYTF